MIVSRPDVSNEPADMAQTALRQGGIDNGEVPRILVVDDNAANLAAFEATLASPDLRVVNARSGAEAMRHLLKGEFAAILLDMNMPELDGIQTAELIRRRERCRDIPIIFITAYHADQMQMLKGYATGAVDFLLKPVSAAILRSKVRVFLDLFYKKRQVEWQATQLRQVNARLRREIAEREQAEKDALFEREERQRVTLASVADGVITTDAQGRVTYVNPIAERLSGWSAEAAVGLALSTVFKVQPTAESGEASGPDPQMRVSRHAILIARDGQRRYVDYAVARVRDRRGAAGGEVLIIHDVTERRQAELERERLLAREQEARKQAEEANRTRDEFLAVISHELRTPLNAIVGWTHVLKRGGLDEPTAQRALEAIHRSAMAQSKLIEDLLDMSRIINGKLQLSMTAVALDAVIQAAAETVRPLAQDKSIEIEIALDDQALTVQGDEARLTQVIWNVLANAVKFSSAGERVRVRLAREETRARITVADNGEGIAAEFLPRLFERFRQADSTLTRKHRGLGLGLAIAQQIICAHGGTIRGESPGLGQGATFTIELPLADPSTTTTSAVNARSAEAKTLTLAGTRVLIVDDEADAREMLSAVIQALGAELRQAGSAAEALAILQQWHPHLLLSDISMPDEDGYTFIRRVRALGEEQGGRVPAVALTAMASMEDRSRAVEAGFDGHLAKPVVPEVLAGTLADLLKRADNPCRIQSSPAGGEGL